MPTFDTVAMKLRAVGVVLLVSLGLGGCMGALDSCNDGQMSTCLRLKALALLDKALDDDVPLVVNEFLTVTRDKTLVGNSTARSEQETNNVFPLDPGQKDDRLDEMIVERILQYLRSRSLQFTIPANIIEGRKRGGGKKGGMMMMAAVAMGGMMVQMAMGKIALLAGKALLVGKMALLLSAIIALKKLFGGGGGGGESHPQVVYAETHGGGGGGGHGGWGRNFEKDVAQQIVYRAQARAL